jgi:hypothetical protein
MLWQQLILLLDLVPIMRLPHQIALSDLLGNGLVILLEKYANRSHEEINWKHERSNDLRCLYRRDTIPDAGSFRKIGKGGQRIEFIPISFTYTTSDN